MTECDLNLKAISILDPFVTFGFVLLNKVKQGKICCIACHHRQKDICTHSLFYFLFGREFEQHKEQADDIRSDAYSSRI